RWVDADGVEDPTRERVEEGLHQLAIAPPGDVIGVGLPQPGPRRPIGDPRAQQRPESPQALLDGIVVEVQPPGRVVLHRVPIAVLEVSARMLREVAKAIEIGLIRGRDHPRRLAREPLVVGVWHAGTVARFIHAPPAPGRSVPAGAQPPASWRSGGAWPGGGAASSGPRAGGRAAPGGTHGEFRSLRDFSLPEPRMMRKARPNGAGTAARLARRLR